MENSRTSTAEKLIWALRQIRRADWRKNGVDGYKFSEVRLLFCLKRGTKPGTSGMKVSEIGQLLEVTSPTVTQLINGLEAQGLVARTVDPDDRRAVRISLTEHGEAITKQASESYSTAVNGLIDFLGDEQSEQLIELLSKVSEYFHEHVDKNADKHELQQQTEQETTSQMSGEEEA
ncbi:MAG: MarR family winged helix-turn-helix transcriptional regulator [Tumebacillaceae bacterium]